MKVLYFAWLRTKVGVPEEDLAPPPAIADVAGLIEWLKLRSAGHAEALADLRVVRVAVNQDHVGLDHPVAPGDEVAFFPPVTGGGR
jgi:molybdopterin synthase sulfur carrier subunit